MEKSLEIDVPHCSYCVLLLLIRNLSLKIKVETPKIIPLLNTQFGPFCNLGLASGQMRLLPSKLPYATDSCDMCMASCCVHMAMLYAYGFLFYASS